MEIPDTVYYLVPYKMAREGREFSLLGRPLHRRLAQTYAAFAEILVVVLIDAHAAQHGVNEADIFLCEPALAVSHLH
jgi:hypothetical protein